MCALRDIIHITVINIYVNLSPSPLTSPNLPIMGDSKGNENPFVKRACVEERLW
jgi:hypothetical protein